MRKRIKAQNDAPGFEVVMEAPLHYSNVMLVDPVSRAPVRARAAWTERGDKTRVGCGRRASGAPIPKPRAWLQDAGPDTRVGAKDTPPEEALRLTRGVSAGGENGEARAAADDDDYVAGRLAPPRPAWLPVPSEGGPGAAEGAALAYERRVEAWARRAYERGLAGASAGGQQQRRQQPQPQQQVRRASSLAASAVAGGAAEAAAALASASAAGAAARRRWVLERTGAPGLGPLPAGKSGRVASRLAGALSALLRVC